MKNERITIPLGLSADEIAMIADEAENTETPEFGEFLGKILRQADEAAHEMGDTIQKINAANPYSRQHTEVKE